MSLRVYRIPFSTNVERVALAAAHKGLPVEWVDISPDDRSEVVRLSGQELVPVLETDDRVIHDSPVILRYLERHWPEPPLWPADPARAAEADVFVEWFNKVWKGPPNFVAAELQKDEPDRARVDEQGQKVTAAVNVFERLLDGRDYLLGDEFGIADATAFPFLRYALYPPDEDDSDVFHEVLHGWQPIDGHPRLEAWIRRVDALPRA